MKRLSHLLAVLLVLSFILTTEAEDKKDASDSSKETKEAFRKVSHDDAVKAAKDENKVVMIDFFATWCGPCKLLDAQTFSQESVKKFLIDKTVAIKVDIDKERDLAKQYSIRVIPTIVFVDGEGEEIGRFQGFRNAEKFIEEAEKHVKQ